MPVLALYLALQLCYSFYVRDLAFVEDVMVIADWLRPRIYAGRSFRSG